MFVSGEHDARSSAASRYAVEAGPADPNDDARSAFAAELLRKRQEGR